ncbi:hypothetical protein DKX38_022077 [Salix brachista]|uniref:3-hydroxyisobutyrate dehydrogenase-like NAD-binding domain-containing protein n=1 Tax=Salix brachista TaxID=2182728 RepID=A0A5N5JYP6_9ROSI|nr:hypothetical protein DKX38_022077 [Salix brachista]
MRGEDDLGKKEKDENNWGGDRLLLNWDFLVLQIDETLVDKFLNLGGTRSASLIEAGKEVAALIVLISHVDQIDDVFFGQQGVLKRLQKEALIILRSTILPSYIQNLEKRLRGHVYCEFINVILFSSWQSFMILFVALFRKYDPHALVLKSVYSIDLTDEDSMAHLIEAYVSRGFSEVLEGRTMVTLKIKMVNELLEGIHLVAALEAISLCTQAGIHPWIVYDIVSNAAGNSWIFKNHIPHFLRGDTKVHSYRTVVQNLVWDTFIIHGVVWDMTKSLIFPLPLLSVTHQQLILAASFLGWQVYKPTLTRFVNAGGLIANSPAETSKAKIIGFLNISCSDVDVLVVMVTNETQAESVLYGDLGAIAGLRRSQDGEDEELKSYKSSLCEGRGLKLVDAPVSGGVKRASEGALTIMASGTDEALTCTGSVLSALSEKLYVITGGCGAGSGVKMINQLVAGVHIASGAEAMALGARLGLNTRMLFDFVKNSGGTSWMFENRVPHMLDNDYTPYSALHIFVKDLGIVTRESSSLKVPLHIATVAHQLFLARVGESKDGVYEWSGFIPKSSSPTAFSSFKSSSINWHLRLDSNSNPPPNPTILSVLTSTPAPPAFSTPPTPIPEERQVSRSLTQSNSHNLTAQTDTSPESLPTS